MVINHLLNGMILQVVDHFQVLQNPPMKSLAFQPWTLICNCSPKGMQLATLGGVAVVSLCAGKRLGMYAACKHVSMSLCKYAAVCTSHVLR